MTFADAHSKKGEEMSLPADRMEGVKVTGDTATATMVKKDGTKTEGRFVRIDGQGCLDLSRKQK